MARHNTCVNPCLSNDAAGWGGGSTPTRTAVSGFSRPFAARYTSGTFSNSARGAVTGGQQVTISQYVRLDTPVATVNGVVYLEWRDAGTNVLGYDSTSYSVPGQAVARQSATFTAPASAAWVSLISEGYNFGVGGPGDFTMMLIEQVGALDAYFDGDTALASWDGTPGSSSSTLDDAVIAGVFNAVLPPLTGAFTGEVTVRGVLAGVLPALTASFTGISDAIDGNAQLTPGSTPVAALTASAAAVATIRSTSR